MNVRTLNAVDGALQKLAQAKTDEEKATHLIALAAFQVNGAVETLGAAESLAGEESTHVAELARCLTALREQLAAVSVKLDTSHGATQPRPEGRS